MSFIVYQLMKKIYKLKIVHAILHLIQRIHLTKIQSPLWKRMDILFILIVLGLVEKFFLI